MKAIVVLVSMLIVGCIVAIVFAPELRGEAWTFFIVSVSVLVTKIVDTQLVNLAAEKAVKRMTDRPAPHDTAKIRAPMPSKTGFTDAPPNEEDGQ